MYGAGICLAVRTADPNIDDSLMQEFIHNKKYPVRVIREGAVSGEEPPCDMTEAEVVSKASVRSLVNAAIMSGRLKFMTRCNAIIHLTALSMGVITASTVLAFQFLGQINSLYMCLFQAFWLLPMMFITNVTQR